MPPLDFAPFVAAADHTKELLLTLFVMFAVAKLAAELFERMGQPAVVGEILAGVLVGPHVLGLVALSETVTALAEIGVMLLLFLVGLEVKPKALYKVGARALAVAVGGVVLPFFAGWGIMAVFGSPTVEGVFIGAAMVATSVGITARVLAGMGLLSLETSQIVLGAAVIDDVLGLLVLSVVTSVSAGTVDLLQIGLTAGLSIGFTVVMLVAGTRLARRAMPVVDKLRVGQALFIAAMVLCLGLSLLATEAGVAPIIGAFLAGMALSEVSEGTELHHEVGTVTEFLVPFFLVSIGIQLDLTVFSDPRVLLLAAVVTVVAIFTKLVGCGVAALPLGRRAALQVGMGMVPRGEVGIIVAQVGLNVGVLTAPLYGVVVCMAVVTTLVAPPFLTRLYAGEQGDQDEEQREALETNDLW